MSAALFFALLAFASNIIVWGYWELNPFAEPARVALDGVIAMLFGANIGVLLHKFDLGRNTGGGTQMTTLGAFAALMTSSCPVCQPIIMLAFGLGGIGSLFAGLSVFIALISAALLAVSLKKGLEDGTCTLETRRRYDGKGD